MDLKKLKGLLGIPESDTTQDAALQFLMEDVDETIRNYCNLKAVPAGLHIIPDGYGPVPV